jgi:hypothetical protein
MSTHFNVTKDQDFSFFISNVFEDHFLADQRDFVCRKQFVCLSVFIDALENRRDNDSPSPPIPIQGKSFSYLREERDMSFEEFTQKAIRQVKEGIPNDFLRHLRLE